MNEAKTKNRTASGTTLGPISDVLPPKVQTIPVSSLVRENLADYTTEQLRDLFRLLDIQLRDSLRTMDMCVEERAVRNGIAPPTRSSYEVLIGLSGEADEKDD